MRKLNVFNKRTLDKYNNDITEELETRRKKMIKFGRLYYSFFFSAIIGIVFLPILLYGFYYPDIDLVTIAFFELIFILMSVFVVRSAKKDYIRLRNMYKRTESKAKMNHDITYALRSVEK